MACDQCIPQPQVILEGRLLMAWTAIAMSCSLLIAIVEASEVKVPIAERGKARQDKAG